jgi:hypothetical protein
MTATVTDRQQEAIERACLSQSMPMSEHYPVEPALDPLRWFANPRVVCHIDFTSFWLWRISFPNGAICWRRTIQEAIQVLPKEHRS